MQKILAGVRRFRAEEYPRQRELFEQLARKQQKPKALFITCSDSRVHPNLVTMTEPGELFLLRNAGNIIPPNGQIGGGEAATIEYSVEVLGIQHIIVCGHSQCGAMQALLANRALDELPAARAFFGHAEATRRIVQQKYRDKGLSPQDLLMAATEENVLVQLNNLSTHPCVAARLASGEVSVYGWYYDIASGSVLQYDQARGRFLELDGEAQAAAPLPIRTTA
ncbi:MAG TPA: carbonic anhydrase [Pirellulaceae bacterium]|jgi:carbonic anhydrase|nr:carbonic anhydrase [Pirellulaceae bacterium]